LKNSTWPGHFLSLNHKEAGEQAGINQVTVGILERGERNAIPVSYANFLYRNGIDLNWVFNNNNDADKNIFRSEESINTKDKLPGQPGHTNIINRQLLETIHLTYTLTRQLEKLHTELSKMKRLNRVFKIKPKVIKQKIGK